VNSRPFILLECFMAKKNSFFIGKVDVPFDEVDSIFNYQSSMDIQVIFQVTEIAFYPVCGLWDSRV